MSAVANAEPFEVVDRQRIGPTFEFRQSSAGMNPGFVEKVLRRAFARNAHSVSPVDPTEMSSQFCGRNCQFLGQRYTTASLYQSGPNARVDPATLAAAHILLAVDDGMEEPVSGRTVLGPYK
jgi:hypothetical protein